MPMMIEGDEVLIEHHYKMCLHGRPFFLVPYELLTLPEGYSYIFNEDKYEPLWSDGDSMMPADRLTDLLKAVAGVIDDIREHLLEISQVAFNEKSVLKDEDGGIHFIYMPFREKEPSEMKSCISSWLTFINRHVDQNCENSMAILHPLAMAAASEHLNLSKFRDLIRKTIGEEL